MYWEKNAERFKKMVGDFFLWIFHQYISEFEWIGSCEHTYMNLDSRLQQSSWKLAIHIDLIKVEGIKVTKISESYKFLKADDFKERKKKKLFWL